MGFHSQPQRSRVASRVGARLILAWLMALPWLVAAQPQSTTEPHNVLHNIREIYTTDKAKLVHGRRAELDARVIYSDGAWGLLFVEDDTGSTYLEAKRDSPTYAPGTRVRLTMHVAADNTGIRLTQIGVSVLGKAVLGKPIAARVQELNDGLHVSARVETRGVLRPCPQQEQHACFRLDDGKAHMTVNVRAPDDAEAHKWYGAVVTIRGASASHLGADGKRDSAALFVDSFRDIDTQTVPLTMESAPTAIHNISADEADVSMVRQYHVRGRISWRFHDQFLVQDATGEIFATVLTTNFLQTGDTVDVIGFPSHGEWGFTLTDAQIALAKEQINSILLVPLQVSAKDILRGAGRGRRVHVKARLMNVSASPTKTVYLLKDEDADFQAILLHAPSSAAQIEFPRGTLVDVTGIALTRRDAASGAEQLTILLQTQTDLLPRAEENWLTWRRALLILLVIAACMIAPMLWVQQLKRTVRKQTAIIRQQYDSELQMEARFRRVIERNLAAFFTLSTEGVILECNDAFAKLLGHEERETLIGRHYADFEADFGQLERALQAQQYGMLSNWETSIHRENGEVAHLLMNITPVESGGAATYETTAIDVTQLRLHQTELQRARDAAVTRSLSDPLTGLPNRRFLEERLRPMLEHAKDKDKRLALLFLDLDGFKFINDTYGHAAGDALLVQVGAGLRAMLRHGDVLGRLGGDEFLVILNEIPDSKAAMSTAESLLAALSRPLLVEGRHLTIGASIGVSFYPEDSVDPDELMRQADNAMYAAKRAGRNCVRRYVEAGIVA